MSVVLAPTQTPQALVPLHTNTATTQSSVTIDSLQISNGSKADLRNVLKNIQDLDQQKQILNSLHNILNTDRSSSIGNHRAVEIVQDIIRDLHQPFNISQADKTTCQAAAGILMKLAYEKPAEYAAIVERLTAANGKAELASGDSLQLLPESVSSGAMSVGSALKERSLVQKIMQSSMMHLAAQLADPNMHYVVAKDFIVDNNGGTGLHGLDPQMYQRLRNSVFNVGSVRLDTVSVGGSSGQQQTSEQILTRVDQALQQGQALVVAEINWGTVGHDKHCIAISKVEGGRVYFAHGWSQFQSVGQTHAAHYDNALGKVESMSVAEFTQRLRSVYLDQSNAEIDSNGRPALTAIDSSRLYNRSLRAGQLYDGIPQNVQTFMTYQRPEDYKSLDMGKGTEILGHNSSVTVAYFHPANSTVDLKKVEVNHGGGQAQPSVVYRDFLRAFKKDDELF